MMTIGGTLNLIRPGRKHLALILLASFVCTLLTPVAAQKREANDKKYYPLPEQPFDRLLVRLNHAPFNFDKLEASARHASPVQNAASNYEATISPVIPVLETVEHSKTLELLARLPFVGKHFEVAETGLKTASELSHGFVHLVDLDKRDIEPLQKAILLSAHLRRSRRIEDLPATVEALDCAILPLKRFEYFSEQHNQKLASYINILVAFDTRHLEHHEGRQKDSQTIKKAVIKLRKINTDLRANTLQIQQVLAYTQDCATDGHSALQVLHKQK